MLALDLVNNSLLVATLLIMASVLTSLLAFRLGTPLLLAFLGVGLLAGNGFIEFDNTQVAFFIGSIALALILFESGYNTRWRSYQLAAAPSLCLSTLGTLFCCVLVAVAAHYLLDFSWPMAFLLAAIISPTDAAAVFLLLRVGGITVRERVRSTLEIESGTNDPVAILLTALCIEVALKHQGVDFLDLGWHFIAHLGLGALAGYLGGRLIAKIINRLDMEAGLYPIASLALALFIFAIAGKIGGSGFLAIYVAGLVLGNRRLRGGQSLRRFQDGLSWLAQIIMFVVLGLLADPNDLLRNLIPALIIAAILIFIARPVVTALCLWPFRFSIKERLFVGWLGLRGAVSILLALLPMAADVPNADDIFAISFLVVVFSLLLQGWTISPLAHALKLIVPEPPGPLKRMELDLPNELNHEIVTYDLQPGAPLLLQGQQNLPAWATPLLLQRGGVTEAYQALKEIRAGDRLFVFVDADKIAQLDPYFATQPQRSMADTEFYGDLQFPAATPLAALTSLYGLTFPNVLPQKTLGDLLAESFEGKYEVGDRITLGEVECVISELDDAEHVKMVGIALPSPNEPPPQDAFSILRRFVTKLFSRRAA